MVKMLSLKLPLLAAVSIVYKWSKIAKVKCFDVILCHPRKKKQPPSQSKTRNLINMALLQPEKDLEAFLKAEP